MIINISGKQGGNIWILGANGAGKTTAIRILCGLSSPTSGKVSVAGYDAYKQSEKIKQNIGYMSQKFSLYEDLTPMENIQFYGGIYRMPAKEIRERSVQLFKNWVLKIIIKN